MGGLTARGNATSESTDAFCSAKVVCQSPMQHYDEGANRCIDPECSQYYFMYLDHSNKMCVWGAMAPICLGIAIAALVGLDLFSHRLYKQAVSRAQEMCQ